MKRPLLHITFWVIYLLQDAFMEFLWLGPALKDMPEHQQLWKALITATLISIPKFLFAYYVIYSAIGRILKSKKSYILNAIEIFLMLAICIVLYRAIFNYYVNPYIYAGVLKHRTLLDASMVLFAVIDIGFVSGAAITLKLLRTQLKAKEREKGLVKEKLETELKFLRNQTNPHFLFNTLNNIYGLARKKSDDTAEVVMKLSQLLRFMIYESNKEFISISEEIKILDDYLELEKIRYSDRLTVTFKKEIDDPATEITPLLLLPLIENAFKHGASESRFDSFIHIRMTLLKNDLNFEIENNKEEGGPDKTIYNIGLGNLRRQLELIYKEYELLVENTSKVFNVKLSINLNSYAKV